MPLALCHAQCGAPKKDKLFLGQHGRKERTVTIFAFTLQLHVNMILTQYTADLLYLIQNFWEKICFGIQNLVDNKNHPLSQYIDVSAMNVYSGQMVSGAFSILKTWIRDCTPIVSEPLLFI